MSWFGHGTVKQRILDEVKHIQEVKEYSDSEMLSILLSVAGYYVEEVDNEEI